MAAENKNSETSNKFAFKVGKSIGPKKLKTSVIAEEVKKEGDKLDFVTSFDAGETTRSQHNQEEEKLVIPLIHSNKWRNKREGEWTGDGGTEEKKRKTESDNGEERSDIDSVAIKELVSDASKQNEDWEERGDLGYSKFSIPLLMKNKVPDGFETDDKLDVSLRPDGAETTDYDAVPIEAYGMAMLRGMGWKDGEGIGKDKTVVAQLEPGLRPKGLGLGADRSMAKKHGKKSARNEEDEELEMKKDAYCQVQSGQNADLYGQVVGLDEDNARVLVKMTIGGDVINVMQIAVRLVTRKEYDKYSKYINKSKVDKYKEKEKEKQEQVNGHERSSQHRESLPQGSRESPHRQRELSHRQRESPHRQRESPHRHRESTHSHRETHSRNSHDERKHQFHSEEKRSSSSKSSSMSRLWIRPQCRVRVVDKKYKKGKYYKSKVIVEDILSENNCLCKTEDGKLLEGLSQSMLETVIPKSERGHVIIVSGRARGQLAEIIHKNKTKCKVTVQLLSDRDQAMEMDFDSVCEYTGDIHAEMDY